MSRVPPAPSAPSSQPAEAAHVVRTLARELGFSLVGITDARPTDHADTVRGWIAAGSHGEMHYLAENLDKRLDPRELLSGAKSIICVADAYVGEQSPDRLAGDAQRPPHPPTGAIGRISRYAWGGDYHKIIKKRLFKLTDALREQFGDDQDFKCTVDTAPLLEREHASRAGLGWMGKHTLLIHPRFGSYMFLGAIVTTLKLETSEQAGYPEPATPPTDHCGTCTRCIDACPTHCITPRSVDATRCISYLTLEHRSLIAPDLHEAMGDWIAGCDVCQEVCPYNQEGYRQPLPIHPHYAPRPPAPALPLDKVLDWSSEDRQAAFTGSALKRIKLDMLKRNALIAAGNFLRKHDDSALRDRINQIATDVDEPALVRQTAQQVLDRI